VAWLPFPFPECPSCHRQWAYSYHYECPQDGQVEVDPDAPQVRCGSCRESWNVWDNKFICACTNTFRTADVQAAIDDIIATASLFEKIVADNRREAAKAKSLGEDSLRTWIQGVATMLGGRLGGLLGTIAGFVARNLFGPG
jgi:hypothetical protein